MYLTDYIIFLIAIGICTLLSVIASAVVNSTFKKYNNTPNSSGMNGFDTVTHLLNSNGVQGVSVGRTGGSLTDHYDPTREIVNLSEVTYDSASVGAVAVAAHEVGHVMQKHKGNLFYKLRTRLVPIVNLLSRFAMPLVVIGLLVDVFATTLEDSVGFYIALTGVAFYGGSLLFALVTLPVEINASRRAINMLTDNNILNSYEIAGARKVLAAAASTYLVSVLISLVYFLRFLLYVLTIFGRRND